MWHGQELKGGLQWKNDLGLYCSLVAWQKHLGCKKMRGQSEATLLTGMCDQKHWYQLRPRSYFINFQLLEWHTIVYSIFSQVFDWLCHLTTFLCHSRRVRYFLASADIRVFGCTCMLATLLLIGLTLFYTPDVFVKHITTFCKQILLLCGSISADAILKLNFEKFKSAIFLTSI